MIITTSILNDLSKINLSLDQAVYLYGLHNPEYVVKLKPIDLFFLTNEKFIENHELTPKGNDVVELLNSMETPSWTSGTEEEFEEFYSQFPPTDKYGSYPRTRVLRTQKDPAYLLYKELRNSYSFHDIKLGLLNEIEFRADATKQGDHNAFKFMKSLYNWLSAKEFLLYKDMDSPTFMQLHGKDIS